MELSFTYDIALSLGCFHDLQSNSSQTRGTGDDISSLTSYARHSGVPAARPFQHFCDLKA
jgi:hypothetical protein